MLTSGILRCAERSYGADVLGLLLQGAQVRHQIDPFVKHMMVFFLLFKLKDHDQKINRQCHCLFMTFKWRRQFT